MAYEARCTNKNCRQLLFDLSGFAAFKRPEPVIITCRGCGLTYEISLVGKDRKRNDIIGFKLPHWKNPKRANRYG